MKRTLLGVPARAAGSSGFSDAWLLQRHLRAGQQSRPAAVQRALLGAWWAVQSQHGCCALPHARWPAWHLDVQLRKLLP